MLRRFFRKNRQWSWPFETYLEFNNKLIDIKHQAIRQISKLKARVKIAGFGANTKKNTFINYCGFDSMSIDCIFDTAKSK